MADKASDLSCQMIVVHTQAMDFASSVAASLRLLADCTDVVLFLEHRLVLSIFKPVLRATEFDCHKVRMIALPLNCRGNGFFSVLSVLLGSPYSCLWRGR